MSRKQKHHKIILKTTFAQTTLKLNLEFEVNFLLHASVEELANDFVISLRQRSKCTNLTQRNALMLDLCWEKVDVLYSVGSTLFQNQCSLKLGSELTPAVLSFLRIILPIWLYAYLSFLAPPHDRVVCFVPVKNAILTVLRIKLNMYTALAG